jgi:hypothetical protein
MEGMSRITLAWSPSWMVCALLASLEACAVGAESVRPDGAIRSDAGRDTGALEMDSGVATDTGAGPSDTGVSPADTGVVTGDTGVSTCPLGQVRCSGRCVDTRSDPMNCGDCGLPCVGLGGAIGTCVNYRCESTCMANRGDCDGNVGNGCEQDLTASPMHCGACGRTCNVANASATCSAGRCLLMACNPSFADCNSLAGDGCEVDTRSDANNCGACAVPCARANATGVCQSSTCRIGACNAGFGDCDGNAMNGCEQDTNSSNTHCGACNRGCSVANGTGGCSGGACRVASCNAGFGNCDGNAANGCETNLNTDPNHCGMCGRRPAEACNLADDNCNGVCDDVGGCRVAVHRSLNAGTGEHFYTTSLAEAMCCGFTVEHTNFYYLYGGGAPGLVQFMRCIAGSKHFYTADPNCEGVTIEGPMGFIATSPVCGAVALYRTVHNSNGDHFYTTSIAERDLAIASGGYINEGIAGYVWTSPMGM